MDEAEPLRGQAGLYTRPTGLIRLDEEDRVWLFPHSRSRGVGGVPHGECESLDQPGKFILSFE
jgi:hypothetical protein